MRTRHDDIAGRFRFDHQCGRQVAFCGACHRGWVGRQREHRPGSGPVQRFGAVLGPVRGDEAVTDDGDGGRDQERSHETTGQPSESGHGWNLRLPGRSCEKSRRDRRRAQPSRTAWYRRIHVPDHHGAHQAPAEDPSHRPVASPRGPGRDHDRDGHRQRRQGTRRRRDNRAPGRLRRRIGSPGPPPFEAATLPGWRNWQTRGTQNPLPSGECGFKSRPGHIADEQVLPCLFGRTHERSGSAGPVRPTFGCRGGIAGSSTSSSV